MYGTPAYINWMTRIVRPHVRDTVLEIGAGIGNLTARLISQRRSAIAIEHDPMHPHALRDRFLRTPNVDVRRMDPEDRTSWEGVRQCAESALCINILEYAEG